MVVVFIPLQAVKKYGAYAAFASMVCSLTKMALSPGKTILIKMMCSRVAARESSMNSRRRCKKCLKETNPRNQTKSKTFDLAKYDANEALLNIKMPSFEVTNIRGK